MEITAGRLDSNSKILQYKQLVMATSAERYFWYCKDMDHAGLQVEVEYKSFYAKILWSLFSFDFNDRIVKNFCN